MKFVKQFKEGTKYQNVNNELQSYRPKKPVDEAIVKTNHCLQRAGLAAVLAFIMSSQEQLLIEKLSLKLTTKS